MNFASLNLCWRQCLRYKNVQGKFSEFNEWKLLYQSKWSESSSESLLTVMYQLCLEQWWFENLNKHRLIHKYKKFLHTNISGFPTKIWKFQTFLMHFNINLINYISNKYKLNKHSVRYICIKDNDSKLALVKSFSYNGVLLFKSIKHLYLVAIKSNTIHIQSCHHIINKFRHLYCKPSPFIQF